MRKFFVIITLILAGQLAAQNSFTLNGEYANHQVKELLTEIESKSDFQFYFQDRWLDSLTFSGSFQNASLDKVLKTAFENTTLSYYQSDHRIIITENAVIIDNPKFLNTFKKVDSKTEVTKGLIFSREYQDQSTDESDLENFVFEVGNRNEMQTSEKYTLAGYVKNLENNEPVEGALVFVQNPFIGTTTDESGFYSLTLPTGKHKVYVQYVGMKTTFRNIILFSNGKLNINMEVDVIALQEVTVESDRDINIRNVQMGVSKINVEEVKTVPIVLGENDIMKIATTKAGVQNVGEGASGFNVRGGKTDQNLILINGAPVYNSSHFFGFFSVFNSDAIENMELYKSGIPAQYGGRLSSIFEITGKEASKESFKGEGGISPITGKLTLEIPLIKDKTSLLIGGRTTYSNWILSKAKNANFRENKVSFFDVLTQLDHKIDEKNDLRFTTYISRDKFRLSSDTLFSFSDFGFTNANTSLKWSHKFTNNLDGSISAIYAHYDYELNYDESIPNAFEQDFYINEATLKADLNYYPQETHKVSLGISSKRYDVNPGEKRPLGSESIVLREKVQDEHGLESALYASSQYEINEDLSFYAGIRYVMFNAMGPKTEYLYLEGSPKNGDTEIDSATYNQGEIIKTYHGPEWRLSGRYTLDPTSSVKLSMSRTRQYIHAMSNSASLSPTDTWRLSGEHLIPQTADQVSLGLYKNLFRSTLEVSLEGYYKWLQNLVDFKTGSSFLLNQKIEREILQGPGKSYGLEVSLNKSGRLNGWLNYAYSRTFIQLDGSSSEETINGGRYFPTAYDKPHTVNLVANYKLTRRLSFSLNTTYNTGRPVTIPVAGFRFKGSSNIHFSDRNSYRIPDYFRVDLGINLEGNHKIQKLSHSFWSLSIYNLTGRDNPFSVFFDVRNGEIVGSQLIVFGDPIPTLSYNFKF
ncbi:MAG: carboxypeptidase-like regulatory domain-containing protein [Marinoscillum sp.]